MINEKQQAEQALDCQTSDGLYHCRHDALCQACQLRHANERVAALTQALKDIRHDIRQQAGAHYDGCNCTFCVVIAKTDAALTGNTNK